MKIRDTIWLQRVVDKLLVKHDVTTEEVDAAIHRLSHVKRLEKGHFENEDLFSGFGRSDAGRYLTIFFIYKSTQEALIISARESTKREKRYHGKRSF